MKVSGYVLHTSLGGQEVTRQTKAFLIMLFLLVSPQVRISASANEHPDIKVSLAIYEVPSMIVSKTVSAIVAADGSVTGTMIGGNTTASFPKDAVVLLDRLPGVPIDADVKEVIREYMSSGCVRPQDIHILTFAHHDFSFGDKLSPGQEICQKDSLTAFEGHYYLECTLHWQTEDEVCLGLRFRMSRQNPFEIQVVGAESPERELLDQIVGVKFSQTSLVGFASFDQKPRGTVYWLAISANKQ